MKLGLVFLHIFDRFADLITSRYAHTGRLGRSVSFILVLPVVLLFVSIGVIQGSLRRGGAQEATVPAHVRQFLQGLPEQHIVRDGKLLHRCDRRVSARQLARMYYDYSRIFEHDALAAEFKIRNTQAFRGDTCEAGQVVTVPEGLLQPLRNAPLGWSADREVRAIYLQGGNSVPGRLTRELLLLKRAKGNAVVFDVKDILGIVNYRSSVAQVERMRSYPPPIPNLSKTIRFLHSQDVYVIARMALFQDRTLAEQKRNWAIQNGNDVLRWKGRPLWVDPALPAVQRYNLQLVAEMVRMGVDEIQFDYVRYPAEGDLSKARYNAVTTAADKTYHLKRFLTAAQLLTADSGTRTAIDIFGIVAWGVEADVAATGQRIEELSQHVDVISPMLYPSHFGLLWDDIRNPADHPKHFYLHGVRRVLARARPGVIVRPWLQAFHWRVTNYDENYVPRQIEGSREGGGIGWMLWNAGNKYEVAYRGMARVPSK